MSEQKENAERGEGAKGGPQGDEVGFGGTSSAEDGKAAAGETPAPSAHPGLAKAKTNGGQERAQGWVGAKYSRHTLLELAKSAAALRRPPDIPLQFCRDEPGNLAERAKNERAARRKDERDKEKERKDKGGKGGREMRGEGEVGFARGAERGQGPGPGAAVGRGEAVTTGDQHRLKMEEVERERAAFAAVRNQQKADDMARKAAGGATAALDVNRSVFGDSISGLGSAADGGGQGILDMLFVGGRGVGGEDDVTAGMGDLSVQITAVVPPEASPSKFATSRAGRWFSPAAANSEGTGDLGFGESGGAELPAAVANLWGSPAPASRSAEQPTGQMPPGTSPMGFPVNHGQQGPMGGVGGMKGHGMMMQRPSGQSGGGQAAPSPQSTLSQLLNINASSAPPPSNPTAAQGSSVPTKMNNLPPPVAPLARPGNSLLSKLLDGGAVAGAHGRPMPNMPQKPMMSAADIERQLLGAAAPGITAASNPGGGGGSFDAANFFARFPGPSGADERRGPDAPRVQGAPVLQAMHPMMQMPNAGPMGTGGAMPGPMGPRPGMGGGPLTRMGAPPPGMLGGAPQGKGGDGFFLGMGARGGGGGGGPGAAGGEGGGGGGMAFDAGAFFKQFQGAKQQLPLPPMPAQASQPSAWPPPH